MEIEEKEEHEIAVQSNGIFQVGNEIAVSISEGLVIDCVFFKTCKTYITVLIKEKPRIIPWSNINWIEAKK